MNRQPFRRAPGTSLVCTKLIGLVLLGVFLALISIHRTISLLSSSVFDRQGSWVEDEDRSIDTAQRLYKLNPSGNEPIAVLFVREIRQAVAILRDCVELPPQTESGADRVSLYQGVAAGGTKQSPEFAESDLNGWDLPLAHSLSQGVAAISFPEL